jgi:hypothetical protein
MTTISFTAQRTITLLPLNAHCFHIIAPRNVNRFHSIYKLWPFINAILVIYSFDHIALFSHSFVSLLDTM